MTLNTVTTIPVENINHPGTTKRVDALMYEAMRAAMLKAMPASENGLTLAELGTRVVPHLPESLYPGGDKSGWWLKTVQLDLEAKGVLVRTKSSPIRLHKAKR